MGNCIIKNVNVFVNDNAQMTTKDVMVVNGKFTESLFEELTNVKIIDGKNKLLLPGIIDLHNDEIEKVIAPKRENFFCDFDVIDKLMVGYYNNGITTVFLALSYSSEPGVRNLDNTYKIMEKICEYKKRFRFASSIGVNLRIELSADWSNLIRFIENYKNEIGIITFCDHSPNNHQNWSTNKYYRYISSRTKMTKKEFEILVSKINLNRNDNVLYLDSLLTKIKEYDIKIGFHDVDRFSKLIKKIDFGEFPTNLQTIKLLHNFCKPVVLGSPNIRNGKSINNNVSAHKICKMNLCDILSSDYDKNSILKSILILEPQFKAEFYNYYKLVSENPANLLELKKGKIQDGYDADFILIDMDTKKPHVYKTFIKGDIAYESFF